MIYLTSSNIFALINYTGFATWVRIIKNILLFCLAPQFYWAVGHSLSLFEIAEMLAQIVRLICFQSDKETL